MKYFRYPGIYPPFINLYRYNVSPYITSDDSNTNNSALVLSVPAVYENVSYDAWFAFAAKINVQLNRNVETRIVRSWSSE